MNHREELIGKEFPVLNHGHVVLMDVMGTDEDIVQAARTSYQKGTKHTSSDRDLLRYLMRHRHTTPFEMVELKFHVKLPIFVERQWIRHRTASTNEMSARYSVLPEEYYVPKPEDVCAQSKSNRQGREGEPIEERVANAFIKGIEEHSTVSFQRYDNDLEHDIARELSRVNLPLGTYTEKVWKQNLHNLFHLLGLRMDSHAQWEIRQYANIIGEEIVAKLFPHSWEAFKDYRLDAMSLTRLDIEMATMMSGFVENARTVGDFMEHQPDEWKGKTNCRERDECLAKLKRLGIILD